MTTNIIDNLHSTMTAALTGSIVETIGMTVVDWWHVTGRPKNCNVLRRIDPAPFFELMLERIGTLP